MFIIKGIIPSKALILDALTPGSATVDWCESNYIVTTYFAEFYNTVSNVLLLVIPALFVFLFGQYGRRITWGCHVVWSLIFLVGIFSAYFHATLSLAGQLLDEFSILWVFNAAFTLWCPRHVLPTIFRENETLFRWVMFTWTICGTALGLVAPILNAFIEMTFAIPSIYLMLQEIKRTSNKRVKLLSLISIGLFIVAVSIWISDRIHCGYWRSLGFPYGHSIWHLLIAISASNSCVIFAYFDAEARHRDEKPTLRLWPDDSAVWLGIPYVALGREQATSKPLPRAKTRVNENNNVYTYCDYATSNGEIGDDYGH